MKYRRFYFGCVLVTLLQALLIGGLVWFNKLSYKLGGVNHHVAYRKRQYNQSIFTPTQVLWMKIALGVLALALILALLWLLWKRSTPGGMLLCGLSALWCAILFWELTSPAFQAIRIYPYAVLGTAVLLALELFLLLLWRVTR